MFHCTRFSTLKKKDHPILVRHSNSLSADYDARIDARGATLRILSDDEPASGSFDSPPHILIELTLNRKHALRSNTF